MAKTSKSIDLGSLQSELEIATRALKSAQRAKLKADQVFEEATAQHERARVSLNGGVAALKSASAVTNLYAA